MCMLFSSWGQKKFILGMNRDEEPDRAHQQYFDQKDAFYPIDSRSKGTWIGMSVDGVVAALLNGDPQEAIGSQTRGQIIPAILSREPIIPEHGLEAYAPFQLFVYDHSNQKAQIYQWNGSEIQVTNSENNVSLVSSSYGVREQRAQLVQQLIGDASLSQEYLKTILKSHHPQASEQSVCMHGSHSETVASTIITIENGIVTMYDTKGAPCTSKNPYQIVKQFEISPQD